MILNPCICATIMRVVSGFKIPSTYMYIATKGEKCTQIGRSTSSDRMFIYICVRHKEQHCSPHIYGLLNYGRWSVTLVQSLVTALGVFFVQSHIVVVVKSQGNMEIHWQNQCGGGGEYSTYFFKLECDYNLLIICWFLCKAERDLLASYNIFFHVFLPWYFHTIVFFSYKTIWNL